MTPLTILLNQQMPYSGLAATVAVGGATSALAGGDAGQGAWTAGMGYIFNAGFKNTDGSLGWEGDPNSQIEPSYAFEKAVGVFIPAFRWVASIMGGASIQSGLPQNPEDLLNQGYQETSHPNAAAAGYRTFENPSTGDKVRFDTGKPGASGFEEVDHYHRYNPNSTGKTDMYIDKNGTPCAKGCNASHLFPGQ